MKCDELEADITFVFGQECRAYNADKADAAFAELKDRIHDLESIPHTDNSAVIDLLSSELEKLRPMEAALEIAVLDNKKYNGRIKELEADKLTLQQRLNVLDSELLRLSQAHNIKISKCGCLERQISELEDERRWRKFSEEKPNEKQWILVYYGYENNRCRFEIRRWDDGCKYDVEFQELYTHWMPLPSAPKEEKC